MAEESPAPLRIFWSYSHADEDLRDRLDTHLSALKHANRVEVWHDRKIPAGSNWRSEIDRELDSAHIILLLVSASFLNSEFCQSVELRRAIERHADGKALVIPIMLRPCDVEGTPIASLQQLPQDGRPITKWGNRDEACRDVARRLRIAVEEWSVRGGTRAAPATPDTAQPEEGTRQEAVLSRIFGFGESVTLQWVRTLLERGAGVARVEDKKGIPRGSGFLVDPTAFGLDQSIGPLLLAASFVITPVALPPSFVTGLRPEEAVVRFEIARVVRGVKAVVWASPVGELCSVLVTLDGLVPGAQPLPIASEPWRPDAHLPSDSAVVIAHPRGENLQFSIGNTRFVDADEVRVHYRAATLPGSAGGAVLKATDLTAVAVNVASNEYMPRLHGEPGTYAVCEGISLLAIQNAVRNRQRTVANAGLE